MYSWVVKLQQPIICPKNGLIQIKNAHNEKAQITV